MRATSLYKRGQSAGATSTLLILIAGFIVLYILFIPAGERQKLLQEDYTYPGGSSEQGIDGTSPAAGGVYLPNATVLQESPGRIDYLKFREYEHPLAAVNLYATTTAKILKQEESLYVKNGIFDKLFRNVTFTIDDLENTDNILLSFNVKRARGRLTVTLNGQVILDSFVDTPTPNPIVLTKESLRDINILEFSVSPVGFAFWTTNEYELQGLKITADVTDISEQASRSTFTVTDVEKFNLQEATLTFFPDCSPRAVGKLSVYINNYQAFSAIPDCGQINVIDISPSVLTAGTNNVVFTTERGDYLIYQIMVKTSLREQTFPAYYFDLDESLFYFSKDYKRDRYYREEVCGAVDGLCPADCTEDQDIDCCFTVRGKYWCDVEPEDSEARCAEIITAEKCSSCASGYEDSSGKIADLCKNVCGDDRDGACPSGCSKYYDKDCCFDSSDDAFWCDNVPRFGLENTCEASISPDECNDCVSGYKAEGAGQACASLGESDTFIDVAQIKPGLKVFLTLTFIDDQEKKSANVYVNGHKFYIDTYDEYYEREITDYVEEGSNAVKIEPDRTTLDIRKLDVDVRGY